MKSNEFSTPEYSAPTCKVVEVHMQNLVCTSPGEGEAGGEFNEVIDPDEY